MSFFDSVYNKLFKSGTKLDQVILHELINRDSKFNYYYSQWKDSENAAELLQKIADGYTMKSRGLTGEINVHLLQSPYSNGFAVTYNDDIGEEAFEYLFDLLAEKVISLESYKKEISDKIITEKSDFIEEKQKHYIKPDRKSQQKPIPQFYGNIHIELIRVNQRPSYLKLLANTYSDQLFSEPYKFESLLNILFGK